MIYIININCIIYVILRIESIVFVHNNNICCRVSVIVCCFSTSFFTIFFTDGGIKFKYFCVYTGPVLVLAILVNLHISAGILSRTALAIVVEILVEIKLTFYKLN